MDAMRPEMTVAQAEEMKSEERRLRLFRFLTDLTRQRLSVEALTLEEARDLVDGLRLLAGRFFPGKTHVFDLVIAPRLERVIGERFGDASHSIGSASHRRSLRP